ncbi:MAG TPA: iron ABC transporter permease [Myxococcota bacterium]|nr:iron ABC transporter permease [Myxococcota bacterium]
MRTLTPARLAAWLAVFAAGLCAVLLVGVAAGPSGLALRDVLDVLREERAATAAHDIVFGVRLPRVALGALVGAALATAGALFQALLRNPLADPFVLGVSGGAAVGGIAALSFGAALGLGYGAVPPAAFAGAVLTTVALQAVAGVAGRVSPTHLLLTGVVFNAFASAAIVFLASMAGLQEGARIFVWLIGSLSSARPELIASVALFLVAGLVCALPAARQLNLLALGEESAQQLGVDVTRLQRLLLLATSLMVGAAVSVAGLVGFVGLIIPHLLRLLLGPDHRLLLPTAALGGAAFLVLCDTAARTLFGGRELPVGAITALAGGPLFLWLLRRQQQRAFAP